MCATSARWTKEGFYRVEVTNGAGTVSSESAKLTVRDPVQVRLVSTPGANASGQVAINPDATLTLRADIGTAIAAEELVGDEKNPPVYIFRRQNKNSKKYELLSTGTVNAYTIDKVKDGDETLYTVTVEGKVNGPVTSSPLKVSVNDKVAFGSNPLKVLNLVKGETVTLGVAVAKGSNPQFEWYRLANPTVDFPNPSWVKIEGGTASSYVLSNVGASDAGSYGVVLYNVINGVPGTQADAARDNRFREIARVSVKSPPSATILDASTPLQQVEGGSLTLRAIVSDTSGSLVQFQWRKDGRAVEKATGASESVLVASSGTAEVRLSKTGLTLEDAGQYELLVSNANGSSLSVSPRLVNVAQRPSIEVLPAPTTVAASVNGTATFRVSAKGTGPLKYQWQKLAAGSDPAEDGNWSNVGDNAPVFSVKASLADHQSRYRVALSIPSAADYVHLGEAYDGACGVSEPKDVRIVVQPRLVRGSLPLAIGSGTVRLEAVAEDLSGGASLSYQWRKDGVAIPVDPKETTEKDFRSVSRGSDGKFVITYDLPTIDNNSDGVYDLVVQNGANFASSEALSLSVDPKILSFDVPAAVNPGDNVKLEVKVAGNGPYSYEWRRNGERVNDVANSVSGAATSVLLLNNVSDATSGTYAVSGTYSVVVTNAAKASNTSLARPLVVARKVEIKSQPSLAGTLKVGEPLTLTVGAEGGGTIAYRWFKDGIEVGNSSTLTVPSVTLEDAGIYQVRVSNASSSEMSSLVTVKVQQPLSAVLPASLQVDRGQSATVLPTVLPVPAKADDYGYVWFRNGVELASATADQYQISPVTASEAGSYTVKVTNKQTGETATSNPLVLGVRLLPQIIVPPASLTVGGQVTSASFAVVVSSTLSVSYKWTKDGKDLQQNSPYLKLTGLTQPGASKITVTATDAHGSASATATLKVLPQTETHNRQDAGSDGVDRLYAYTSWWVFWADALGSSRNGIYMPGSTKSGYWLLERKSAPGKNGLVVTPGESVWIWGDSLNPNEQDLYEQKWTVDEQFVLDAMDSESSEFSSLAQSVDATRRFTVGGRVEPSGEASLYGAPAVLEGFYEDEKSNSEYAGRMDVNLVWDSGQVLDLKDFVNSDPNQSAINKAKEHLKKVLLIELAKIKGE
jgi:hypothetical protein